MKTTIPFSLIDPFIDQLLIKVGIVLAMLIITYFTLKIIHKAVNHLCKRKKFAPHTCMILNKAIRYSLVSFALVITLENIGIKISPLIAAFGITGVAISFGMKDIISNIVAGIMIMLYKQFEINDHIKIKDWQGIVTDINIRYTTLEHEGITIFVPNSVLYSTTVALIKKGNTNS